MPSEHKTFDEKFIDRNIAELSKDYILQFSLNVNTSRMSPQIIDGLKPVGRRLLYAMYLKDQGKKLRKVASIAGDVIGRLHPHGPTSVVTCLVNFAQPWNNNVPLIYGSGNFGSCHDKETEVLTRKGWKYFKDVTYDDEFLTFDPESHFELFQKPINIVKYHYTGEMIRGYSLSYDFLVTPNHKMLIQNKLTKGFEFINAEDLKQKSGLLTEMFIQRNLKSGSFTEAHYIDEAMISTEKYDDMVYCVEVPWYHTLFTRRNGRVLISGNCSGARAGADRYIQAKLSDFAFDCYFSEWNIANVDMQMAFNEEDMEPLYLPAKYPVILVNGILGIGTGMASNIPPYNFKEVAETTVRLIKNPNDKIELIPDSPTGCDVCGGNFKKINEYGHGVYTMRSKYIIDPIKNTIKITHIPYLIASDDIRERIAEIKENKGLPEIIDLEDATKQNVDLTIYLKNDVNPYKFVKKLFANVKGLENSYPVNILISDDFRTYEMSIRELLNEWIKYRREQKRTIMNYKRTLLLAEQRTNDVKIFVMDKERLDETIELFRSSRNRKETEEKLIVKYKHTEIEMDSLQAKTLSDMRLHELNIETYEKCLKRRDELKEEIKIIDNILSSDDGIDDIIIGELREGIKKYGTPRKSKLVPWDIEAYQEIKESCILQLSSNGYIQKTISTDLSEEPIPLDNNGFAVRVDSESAFIAIDKFGYYSLIKAKEIPLDSEVPLSRYIDNNLSTIIALLPYDETDKYVTLISSKGTMKKFKINDMRKSKKACMYLEGDDYIVKGVMTLPNTVYDILVYTSNGYGQRINASDIRITSPFAKGTEGIKVPEDDLIEGIYRINKNDEFLVYVTTKGRFRLNKSKYLPTRKNKHDDMVRLIKLVDRDKLISVIGTSMLDKLEVFFDDQTSEIINVSDMKLSTMSGEAVKLTKKSAVSNTITKVKKIQ